MKKSDVKERFTEMVKDAGYENIRQFSLACGVNHSNILTNLKGKFKPSVDRINIYSKYLNVDFMVLFEMFYPEICAENSKRMKRASSGRRKESK